MSQPQLNHYVTSTSSVFGFDMKMPFLTTPPHPTHPTPSTKNLNGSLEESHINIYCLLANNRTTITKLTTTIPSAG